MSIAIRKPAEIEKLRRANRIVGETLQYLKESVKPGMTLKEIDAMGEEFLRSRGAKPSFKGLYGFPAEDERLIACAKDALYHAIDIIRPGMRFKELSLELEEFIRSRGFTPLLNFCGHGIGRKPHEEPEIPNYLEHGSPKSGPKIKNGMVFCLEPMICQKSGTPRILDDKWSVVCEDGLRRVLRKEKEEKWQKMM